MRPAPLSAALAVAIALLPLPALAQCPGQVVFSCKVKAKRLEVCLTATSATYTFGAPGKPDLSITTPLTELDYQPWPGVSRTIWDSVIFHNAGVDYEVWASIDKLMEEGQPEPDWQGGVNVMQGDKTLASITCSAPPDPPFLQDLFDAKTAAGQCWNFDTHAWQGGGCAP